MRLKKGGGSWAVDCGVWGGERTNLRCVWSWGLGSLGKNAVRGCFLLQVLFFGFAEVVGGRGVACGLWVVWGGVFGSGIRFVLQILFFGFAEAVEGFEGAVDDSLEAGLVAAEEGEGAGVVGEGFEGHGGAYLVVDVSEIPFDLVALPGDFDVED